MSDYESLSVCINSGQVDAAQIEAHFKDEVFAEWYRRRSRLRQETRAGIWLSRVTMVKHAWCVEL